MRKQFGIFDLIETNNSADYSLSDKDNFSNNEVCNIFNWAVRNSLGPFIIYGLKNSSTQKKKLFCRAKEYRIQIIENTSQIHYVSSKNNH
jgi:hypothetical protein